MKSVIISELYSSESKSQSTLLLKNAINLANLSVKYANFNFAMEILSALYNPAIFTNDKMKSWDVRSFFQNIHNVIYQLLIKIIINSL